MSIRFNFTKKNLLSLENATNRRYYVYDEKINGLGLSITQNASKSFFVYRKINGIPKRITLGKFPDMTVEQACPSPINLFQI